MHNESLCEVEAASYFLQQALYSYRIQESEYILQWGCVKEDFACFLTLEQFNKIEQSQRQRLKALYSEYRQTYQMYRRFRVKFNRNVLIRRQAGSTWDCILHALPRLIVTVQKEDKAHYEKALADSIAEVNKSKELYPD